MIDTLAMPAFEEVPLVLLQLMVADSSVTTYRHDLAPLETPLVNSQYIQ